MNCILLDQNLTVVIRDELIVLLLLLYLLNGRLCLLLVDLLRTFLIKIGLLNCHFLVVCSDIVVYIRQKVGVWVEDEVGRGAAFGFFFLLFFEVGMLADLLADLGNVLILILW